MKKKEIKESFLIRENDTTIYLDIHTDKIKNEIDV